MPKIPDSDFPARLDACITLLEEIVADRRVLSGTHLDTRKRLLEAAGRVSLPDRAAQRKLAKGIRQRKRDERREHDASLVATTAMRVEQRAAVFATPLPAASTETKSTPDEAPAKELLVPRKCYVCKAEYKTLHFFYDQLCPPCAELNWEKRNPRADLRGRTAIVTGSRVKIGYQAAIFLLRAGARVIVTTRFPRDAASRYAREPDFAEWASRIHVYGLDLRHTPSVEAFATHVAERYESLDFLLNNACQTVRRPRKFYEHLLAGEAETLAKRPELERGLLEAYETLRVRGSERRLGAPGSNDALARAAGLQEPAGLSQLALVEEDLERQDHLFPQGALDQDRQQVDLRGRNSWRLRLHEISSAELLEVHLVNAVAPFVLAARLKPVMTRLGRKDLHIVNVSAMEGQFYRSFKTDKHPHTNMAKAALNMLTRTSACDYVKDGIHMNSVDTGWVTDEDPAAIAARKVEEHGFAPPLDVVDGAARIVDPIFTGVRTGQHVFGKFLKDYAETDW